MLACGPCKESSGRGLFWLMVLEVSGNDSLTLLAFEPLARPYIMIGAYGDANCLPHG